MKLTGKVKMLYRLAVIIYLYFIVISSVSYYNLIFVNDVVVVASQGLSLFSIFFLLIKQHYRAKSELDKIVKLILISVLLGLSYSVIFWKQPIVQAFIVHRELLFYFTFFMLLAIRPVPKDVMRILLVIAIVFALLFLVQYLVYPYVLLTSKISLERETIRVYMTGTYILYFGLMFSSYKLLKRLELKFFLLFCLFSVVVLLRGTRSEIVACIIPCIVMVTSVSKSKVKSMFLIAAAMLIVTSYFGSILTSLQDTTLKSYESNESDIRILSIEYFLYEFPPNSIAYLTGNGIASENNSYGKKIKMLKEDFGLYQSDIGLFGDYSKFGIIYIVAITILVLFVYKVKILENRMYLKYAFIPIFVSMFINSAFTIAAGIVPVCFLMYLLDHASKEFKFIHSSLYVSFIKDKSESV